MSIVGNKGKQKTLIVSFFVMLLIAVVIVFTIISGRKQRNIEHAYYMMTSETSKLQYAIDSRLLTTKILEMIVNNEHGEIHDFKRIAEILYEEDPSLRSIQLAPDGIVSYVYPEQGNENAYVDLFQDPERRKEAEHARDTGEMTLAGPYELLQGGMGLIARNPIYVKDEAGNPSFWGFSIVVLNLPEIFNRVNLDLLTDQDYYYRVWRINPNTNQVQSIAENTDIELPEAAIGEIHVPNGTWYLSLLPQNGWVPAWEIFTEAFAALFIVSLATLALGCFLTVLHQKEELINQANTDSLTGIKNGRYFLEKIKLLAALDTKFVLFYLDMNNFKQINDQYGHDTGDRVLQAVANRIRDCIRDTDIAARIGGDEFTVIITQNSTEEFCHSMKQRLQQNVAQPYTLSDGTFFPEISVGFARYPEDSAEVESVMRMADQRMYDEKRRLKNEKSTAACRHLGLAGHSNS